MSEAIAEQESLPEVAEEESNSCGLVRMPHASEIFTNQGLDLLLEACEKKALALIQDQDLSTKQGRKKIASDAYLVARTKTGIDEAGQSLTVEYREKVAAINTQRKRASEFMQKLQDQVRAPLNEWEAAEQKQIAANQDLILKIQNMARFPETLSLTMEIVQKRIDELTDLAIHKWDLAFAAKGQKAIENSGAILEAMTTRNSGSNWSGNASRRSGSTSKRATGPGTNGTSDVFPCGGG
jgi:hypothetical protein